MTHHLRACCVHYSTFCSICGSVVRLLRDSEVVSQDIQQRIFISRCPDDQITISEKKVRKCIVVCSEFMWFHSKHTTTTHPCPSGLRRRSGRPATLTKNGQPLMEHTRPWWSRQALDTILIPATRGFPHCWSSIIPGCLQPQAIELHMDISILGNFR